MTGSLAWQFSRTPNRREWFASDCKSRVFGITRDKSNWLSASMLRLMSQRTSGTFFDATSTSASPPGEQITSDNALLRPNRLCAQTARCTYPHRHGPTARRMTPEDTERIVRDSLECQERAFTTLAVASLPPLQSTPPTAFDRPHSQSATRTY